MNKEILRKFGFEEELARIDKGLCPFCGEQVDPESFDDGASLKEFELSGLCQTCQNQVFGGGLHE